MLHKRKRRKKSTKLIELIAYQLVVLAKFRLNVLNKQIFIQFSIHKTEFNEMTNVEDIELSHNKKKREIPFFHVNRLLTI